MTAAGYVFEGDALTVDDLLRAVRVLRDANVPTFDGHYWARINPFNSLGQEIRRLNNRMRYPGGRKARAAARRLRAMGLA